MNIFKYSDIKNYQNHEFFLAVFDVFSKNLNHQFRQDDYRQLLSNSFGFFLTKNFNDNQLLNYQTFSKIIIDNILHIGEVIDNGGFLLVDKELNPANNPVITLHSQNDLTSIAQELEDLKSITSFIPKTTQQKAQHKKNLERQNLLIINENNIQEYKDKIIQFLVVSLNLDPFIRIPMEHTANDVNFENIFLNNLNMFSFFYPQSSFKDVGNNKLNNKLLKPFFDKKHNPSSQYNDPFSLIKLFFDEKTSPIDNEIVFDFKSFFSHLCQKISSNTEQFNTSDSFDILFPNISFEPHHEPYYLNYQSSDPDYDSTSSYKTTTFSQVLYTTNLLPMQEKFSTNSTIYQSDYPSELPGHISEFFLLKLFNNYKKDSSIFYQKDYQHIISPNKLLLLSLFRGLIQDKFPHHTSKLDDFFFNVLHSPNALLHAIHYCKSQSPAIFSDNHIDKVKEKFINIFSSEHKEELISQLLLKYELDQNLIECSQKTLSEHNQINSVIDNISFNHESLQYFKINQNTSHQICFIPTLDLFTFSSSVNYSSIESLLEQCDPNIKKSLQSISPDDFFLFIDSKNLILLSPKTLSKELSTDLLNNLANYLIEKSDNPSIQNNEFFSEIQKFYNEINILASLPNKENKSIKKQKI